MIQVAPATRVTPAIPHDGELPGANVVGAKAVESAKARSIASCTYRPRPSASARAIGQDCMPRPDAAGLCLESPTPFIHAKL